MESESNNCTCTNEGYSPDCPQAFYQNGKTLHVLNRNDQLKPRLYGSIQQDVSKYEDSDSDVMPDLIPATSSSIPAPLRSLTTNQIRQKGRQLTYEQMFGSSPTTTDSTDSTDQCIGTDIQREFKTNSRLFANARETTGPQQNYDDIDMRADNRRVLRKFESLKIGTKSLVGLSIGGYAVDLSKAAQKAKEIMPFPQSKLPLIFIDDDLNFLHHFFQGLESLMGRETVLTIVKTQSHFNRTESLVFPLIADMLTRGYERTDNELTIFTKKVLMATFEADPGNEYNEEGKTLNVAANLFGFQYIESGMQCKEADLKMWLSICYSHYRTVWFNTFKSAGIPDFALEGVQARYESKDSDVHKHPGDMDWSFLQENREKTMIISDRKKPREHRDREHRKQRKGRSSDSVIDSIFGTKR